MHRRAPRFAERVVAGFIPNPVLRQEVLDDLAEEYARRRQQSDVSAATWYWMQMFASTPHLARYTLYSVGHAMVLAHIVLSAVLYALVFAVIITVNRALSTALGPGDIACVVFAITSILFAACMGGVLGAANARMRMRAPMAGTVVPAALTFVVFIARAAISSSTTPMWYVAGLHLGVVMGLVIATVTLQRHCTVSE